MGRTESSAPTNGSADVLTGRRDTRVPPYRVRRFYGAGRVVRPYKRLSGISMWDVEEAVPYNALPKATTPDQMVGGRFFCSVRCARSRRRP